ncbi:hypothetical protein SBA3_2940015 [Candidatus Sulfopaludibacter sp. SbA3]|nr:hypothetical protein SBA3_2940015 [Candidatus Sulfopaludibacter sp. SbA3]
MKRVADIGVKLQRPAAISDNDDSAETQGIECSKGCSRQLSLFEPTSLRAARNVDGAVNFPERDLAGLSRHFSGTGVTRPSREAMIGVCKPF